MLDYHMDSNKTQKQDIPVSVEKLLQLKRYETPTEDFWSQFDRELEKKRLQTMVCHDPWHVRLYHAFLTTLHPVTAFGVAAVVVLGGIFYYQQGGLDSVEQEAPAGSSGEKQLASVSGSADKTEEEPVELVEPLQLRDLQIAFNGYGNSIRQTSRISFSETDFGVDVIAPGRDNSQFRHFRTDMEPSTFKTSRQESMDYNADSLILKPRSISLQVGSSSSY